MSHDRDGVARQTSEGGVDPTFGGPGGIAQRPTDAGFDTQLSVVAVQDDNSIISVETMRFAPGCAESSLVVRRLGPEGSFEPGFGADGKLVLTPGDCFMRLRVVPVRPDYFLLFYAGSSFLLDPFAVAISSDGRVFDDFADRGTLSDASVFGTLDLTGDRWVWATLEEDYQVVLRAFWL